MSFCVMRTGKQLRNSQPEIHPREMPDIDLVMTGSCAEKRCCKTLKNSPKRFKTGPKVFKTLQNRSKLVKTGPILILEYAHQVVPVLFAGGFA